MILSQGHRSAEKNWSESHPYVSQGVIWWKNKRSWSFRFWLPQGKEPQEYNPFAEAESAVGMEAIDWFQAVEKAVEKVK